MPKYNSLDDYKKTLNELALNCYEELKTIISNIDLNIKERLFAGQIAFYVEENLSHTFHSSPVIILAFFDDHVNIFASSNKDFEDVLTDYKFTSKHTLQLYYNLSIDQRNLRQLFYEALIVK